MRETYKFIFYILYLSLVVVIVFYTNFNLKYCLVSFYVGQLQRVYKRLLKKNTTFFWKTYRELDRDSKLNWFNAIFILSKLCLQIFHYTLSNIFLIVISIMHGKCVWDARDHDQIGHNFYIRATTYLYGMLMHA